MADRARVTYTGSSRVIVPGSGRPFPVDEVGPGDVVEVDGDTAEGLVERGDFAYVADDAEVALTTDAYGTPPALEPVPLDVRREAVSDALEAVDGDLERLRGAALDDAIRAAFGADVEIPRSLAERHALLASATPATDPEISA